VLAPQRAQETIVAERVSGHAPTPDPG
jgi:hypothetical protein